MGRDGEVNRKSHGPLEEIEGCDNLLVDPSNCHREEIGHVDSKTQAGAQQRREGLKKHEHGNGTDGDCVQQEDPQSGSSEESLYECKEVDCLWPCTHHVHPHPNRDFVWEPGLAFNSTRECSYCLLFVDLTSNYCACQSNLTRDDGREVHQCSWIGAHYEGRAVLWCLTVMSSCGGVELELAVSRGME